MSIIAEVFVSLSRRDGLSIAVLPEHLRIPGNDWFLPASDSVLAGCPKSTNETDCFKR
jgi:hypothetical protein